MHNPFGIQMKKQKNIPQSMSGKRTRLKIITKISPNLLVTTHSKEKQT